MTRRVSWTKLGCLLAVLSAVAPALIAWPRLGMSRPKVADLRHRGRAPVPADEQPRWAHAPFLLGDCSICHMRADPRDPGKTKLPVHELCVRCHDSTLRRIEEETPHRPAVEDCANCHNPHNSQYRMLLHTPPKELCLNCHPQIEAGIKNSPVQHAPVVRGKTCRNCHYAHASSEQHLLKAPPTQLCLTCHAKDGLKAFDGRPLVNVGAQLEQYPYIHEPVGKKACSSCHQSHSGEHFSLLVRSYPKEFYTSYSKSRYALCLSCHPESSFVKKYTTLTGFRDGTRNLHAVHVSSPRKGRTCRACHRAHVAEQMHLIRKSVPYGNGTWELPINFIRTPSGGRCAKTCHGAVEYNNQ